MIDIRALLSYDVRFINSTEEIFALLKSGQAAVGVIHHFDALRELRSTGPSVGYLWDNHVVDMDVFAIPSGAGNPNLAADFIANVSRGAYQTAMATVTGYGPARLSAAKAVQKQTVGNGAKDEVSGAEKGCCYSAEHMEDGEGEKEVQKRCGEGG